MSEHQHTEPFTAAPDKADEFDEVLAGEKGKELLRLMWPLMPFYESLVAFLETAADAPTPVWTEICGKPKAGGDTVLSGIRFWATSGGETPVTRATELAGKVRDLSAQLTTLQKQLAIAMMGLEHYANPFAWRCRYDGLVGHRCNGDCQKTTMYGGHGYDLATTTIASVTGERGK